MASFMTMSRPVVSSPLAASSQSTNSSQRIPPRRNASFPSSRGIRPFASISNALQPLASNKSQKHKAVKLIVPPAHQQGTFVLNLTQAEFSRQN
ncbi:hypothetical protein C8J56DRAFT_818391 [Mycena floridula]|nr:hypothetical protein C8J56DRAFT_818391 [Mycena floridula]